MASSWGDSWGSFWGDSWGSITVDTDLWSVKPNDSSASWSALGNENSLWTVENNDAGVWVEHPPKYD